MNMQLLLLAILGIILLVIDRYTRSEWVRVTGIILIVVAAVLFLGLVTAGRGFVI